jgi:hypothetical protein
MINKPILCLDFDGVLHSYSSGWIEHDFIPDPPVPGAMQFLAEAIQHFDVKIFSSRSNPKYEGGIRAMITWTAYWARKQLTNEEPTYIANSVINALCHNKEAWPTTKPAAFLTIDDRALTFEGNWPSINELKSFKPWNKREHLGAAVRRLGLAGP